MIGAPYALAHPGWEVPAFLHLELRPRRGPYCVCVPVIDEGERIRRQLGKMRGLMETLDVAICDGGSRDGSVAPDFLRAVGARALLTKTGPGRLSAQMRMGMAWALEQGYAGLVFVDGNDKDDTSAIPRFIAELEAGVDHVQGSRYVPGGEGVNTPFSRHWGVKLLHAPLISLAARHRYTDTTNGFRAYSARLLLDERVQPFRDVFVSYELHYYLAIRAARLGFRVSEVPVTRTYPPKGRTPSKISPLRGNLEVLRTVFRTMGHAYDPALRRRNDMTSALIGHTGFVGGNLKRQARFEELYNSKNVEELAGRELDLVVGAGAPAVKWLANKEPEADRASIARLTGALEGVTARRFVLISTVDVYPTPVDVDEDSAVEGEVQPYGKHRLELERFVAERFPDHLIARLPALFGPGLKKNVVYDFLHQNRLEAIPADGVFQFYDLANLWADLERARAAGLRLVNLATEPVSVREVAREAFGFEFDNPAVTAKPRYDFHTKHADVWGRSGPYLYDRGQVLAAMKAFVAAERERLA